MSKGTILITDSLFIFKEHEDILKNVGYEIERLDKPNASEDELIEALDGKVGYILGGVEKISARVFKEAKDLKAVSITAAGWKHFTPGYEEAFAKNILISNSPGANAYAVAEYSLAGLLQLSRNLIGLGRGGDKKFETTKSIPEMTIGIIGMGNIGTIFARMMKGLGAKKIQYFSRTRKEELEKELGIEYVGMDEILQQSDVITNFVPKDQGVQIKEEQFAMMKQGVIFINTGSEIYVDRDAMYINIVSGKIRVFQDHHIDEERFHKLPQENWANSNMSTAYNTFYANKKASDIVTQSMLNLLEEGTDEHMVNI